MKRFFIFALLCVSSAAQAVRRPAPCKTVYVSHVFATEQEAKEALAREGFFLFDIHGVLFKRGRYLKAVKKIKNKKKFLSQGLKVVFSKKVQKAYRQRRKEGNQITERHFDSVKEFQHLHQELIDFSNNIFFPNEKLQGLLLQLKNEGRELYLLSNIGNVTLERLVAQHPHLFGMMTDTRNTINRTAFDDTQYVWKPRLDAFEQALSTINKSHKRELAIFVDDSLINVQKAHEAGLTAIHFTTYAQFFHDVMTLLKPSVTPA